MKHAYSEDLTKELIITVMFYSLLGLRTVSKRIYDNTIFYEFSVPSDSELIMNGKPSICGNQFKNLTEETLNYYYKKLQEILNSSTSTIKIDCQIRKEVWNINLFKNTLKLKSPIFDEYNMDYDKFIDSIEFIGANGINVSMNNFNNL